MPHNHEHQHAAHENIRIAFLLNFGFAIAEFVGGVLTNSIAILADALHDMGDSITLAISWRLEALSEKGQDGKYSYGYKRFSLLSALASGLVMLAGSVFIISEAVQRMIDPQQPSAPGMLVFALVGIAVNGYAALRTRKGGSLNSKMISWHLIEDVLGWVAVLIVAVILSFIDFPILDPLLSLVVTAIVIYNVVINLIQVLRLFLQGVPDTMDVTQIEKEICALDKVKDIHHTHLWSLDGEQNVLTMHIVLDLDAKKEEIRAVKNKIREFSEKYGLAHTTVEFEYLDEDCSMNHNCEEDLEKKEENST